MSDSGDKSKAVTIEAVFQEALALEAADRSEFLERVCPDAGFSARIDALLAAHDQESGFLPGGDSIETVASDVSASEETGMLIGRYKLLEKLGEGGFGSVWAAEQREPVKRRVALKIIKLGMDTKQVVARFEAERQALALMDHPNIAKVLDAGTTDTGRPYFVMELVKGIPITKYFEQEGTKVTEKLQLFMRVCQAIQHAHQKGIIHRDIKPSNVMVTLHDGEPVPKVIDFGIAKATQGELTDKTIYTQYSQFIGTPAYMSPEQAEMSGLDVDTRSDIYSLGVLLYEILTGTTPFETSELMASGIDEMRKIIRERDPVRPSTRLTQTLEEDGSPRGSHVQQLRLSRELDWIVLRCLEKDRSRRYETAIGLAKDVQRHLDNEPVLACPPSRLYRLQKAWRRNKFAWGAMAAVAASLVLGMTGSLWMADEARRQKNEANQARSDAEQKRIEAVQSREKAEAAERATWLQKEETRLRTYVAEINVAGKAIQKGNLAPALALLDQQIPVGDEEDLRGIEWRFLWGESRSPALKTFDDEGARAIAFSPDSRLLAYSDHKTIIRDVASRGIVKTLDHDAGSLAFAPKRNLFVSANSSQVIVWNMGAWREEQVLKGATTPVLFSPDGRWLITGESNGYRLWDTDSWQPGERLASDFENGTGRGLSASSAGDLLVLPIREQPRFRVVKFPSLEPVSIQSQSPCWMLSAGFLNEPGRLITGSGLGALSEWDVNSGMLVSDVENAHGGFIQRIVRSPDGLRFATASSDRTLKIWDAELMKQMAILRGHLGELQCLAWSPDGRLLASGAFDGTTRLWDAKTEIDPKEFPAVNIIHRVGYSADERLFASITDDPSELELWDLESASHRKVSVAPELPSSMGEVSVVEIYGSPPMIALGRSEGTVELWNPRTERSEATWSAYSEEIRFIEAAPNGESVAIATEEELGVWDLATRSLIYGVKHPGGTIVDLKFSRDNALLAVGGVDQKVIVWDARTGQRTRTLTFEKADTIASLRFSPDGAYLAAGTRDSNLVHLWEVGTWHYLDALEGHIQGVGNIDFSPDSRTIITASIDRSLTFWNLATRQELLSLTFDGPVVGMEISTDGRFLLLTVREKEWNTLIKTWELPSWEEIEKWEGGREFKG